MCKKIYGFLAETKLRQINLFDYLKLAQKYDKVFEHPGRVLAEDEEHEGFYRIVEDFMPDEPIFIKVNEETTCAFFENLLFTFSHDPEPQNSIIRIHIKRPEDKWLFRFNNKSGFDVLNPANVHAEVYIAYSVSVLRVNRCIGEDYKGGSWNKSFYKSLLSFVDKVNAYTEISQLKEAYKK